MNLKPIKTEFEVKFTPEEIIEYNLLVSKNKLERGVPTADKEVNECPRCGAKFGKTAHYCSACGQYVMFTKSDIVPL